VFLVGQHLSVSGIVIRIPTGSFVQSERILGFHNNSTVRSLSQGTWWFPLYGPNICPLPIICKCLGFNYDLKVCDDGTLVQILCFWTLSIVLKTLFSLYYKIQRLGDWILSPSSGKTYSVGPSSRAIPYLRTPVPAPRWGIQATHSIYYLRELRKH
jgi:hypothetical protein